MLQSVDYQCAICASTLHFTAQESTYQLQRAVKQETEKLPSVLSMRGFEISGLGSAADIEAAAIHLNPYEQDDSSLGWMTKHDTMRKAVRTKQVQRFFDDQCWWCFIPVIYPESMHSIWVAEFGETVDESDLERILMLSKIYHNCASHIGLQNNDALTGLKNRQALSYRLSRILQAKRRGKDLSGAGLPSICMMDIDYFKRVNDEFGHLYGDEVLLLFARIMKKTFRENDFLCRYGGEEFVVVLDTNLELETEIALERFRRAVDEYAFPQVGHVSVSIGFVKMVMGEHPSSLVDKADHALYYAKKHGRNQVYSYQKLLEKGLIDESEMKLDVDVF